MIAIMNGGAIPETALYTVVAEPEGTVVGTLHEDFAVESLKGDIVLLGNTSWRIRRIESAGRVLVEESKLDEAEPRLQEALTIFHNDASSKFKPELAGQAANWLGAIQLARKAYPEAEALMLPDSERFFARAAEMSPNERRVAVGHIVSLYQAWGKPEQTATWQKKLDGLAKK